MSICSEVRRYFENMYESIFTDEFKVVVLGLNNSGKTSTIRSVFNISKISRNNEINLTDYYSENVKFHIVDIKGGRKQRRYWDYFYKKSDVLIYCVDLSASEDVWDESKFELLSLIKRNNKNLKNMLVLGTKNEKSRSLEVNEMIIKLGLTSILDVEIACYSISAKNQINLELIKPWLHEQYNLKRINK